MSLTQDYDYIFKILIIGESSVGKSSILNQYTENIFSQSFLPTIGVDFKLKNIRMDDSLIKLQLWDTAGQERFKTITNNYYRGAHGIMFVYDVTNLQSFKAIQNYLTEVSQHCSRPQEIGKILIGNKCDLENRKVEQETAKAYAATLGMSFYETSAKNSQNIEAAFTAMVKLLKQRFVKIKREKVTCPPKPILTLKKQDRKTCC